MYMTRSNNNSNQSLGSLRYKPYKDNISLVQKGQIDRVSGNDKGFFDSLGDYWKKGKEAVWGTPVTSLSRDALGNFDTSIMDLKQWEDFSKAGGYVGDKGQLFNKDGTPADLSKIEGVDTSKLNQTTEGGLGGLFSSDGFKAAGEVAKTAGHVFSAYQAADNIFGSGAKSRKEAEKQAKADFEQRYAMNQMTMDKFREDNEHFKKQRAAITASY